MPRTKRGEDREERGVTCANQERRTLNLKVKDEVSLTSLLTKVRVFSASR
jgi:hypothetical protein